MQAFLNNKKQIFIMKSICPKHMAEVTNSTISSKLIQNIWVQ